METKGTWVLKKGLAEMLKGGVIMDVTTPEQAKIAEEAGACAVMALERVPSDIRAAGGVARMADPTIITSIMEVSTIPVMAKSRIGHFVEAQILEALGADYIDESEVLTPADDKFHINKHDFKAFGYYRLVLGIIIFLFFILKYLSPSGKYAILIVSLCFYSVHFIQKPFLFII